jgi:hypothetical protein
MSKGRDAKEREMFEELEESLVEQKDSEDEYSPSRKTVLNARVYIRKIASLGIVTPVIYADDDSVVFQWVKCPSVLLSITINEDKMEYRTIVKYEKIKFYSGAQELLPAGVASIFACFFLEGNKTND